MRKTCSLVLFLAFIAAVLPTQVSASIDDILKHYQQVYMWEKVATSCKSKAPTELQEDWLFIEGILKFQDGYWGRKQSNN